MSALTISKYDSEFALTAKTFEKASVNVYSVAADLVKREEAFDEYEIILNELPKTNIFVMPYTVKDCTFYYQPPLTQELDPRDYDSITETEAYKDGKLAVQRPENVVGSYAVYGNKQGGIYQTGKLFHIYRPWVEDAKGVRVWCTLEVKDSTLIVVVPQKFLDTAAYPVIVDPTFGYTTAGSSSAILYLTGYSYGAKAALTETATISKITAYISASGSTSAYAGLYERVSSPYSRYGVTAETASIQTAGWYDFTFSSPLTGQVAEDKMLTLGQGSGSVELYYDSGGEDSNNLFFVDSVLPESWTDAGSSIWGGILSIYVTYTVPSSGQQLFCLLNMMGY
jgi:hypothetical protein